WIHGHELVEKSRRSHGNILELVRDDIALARELREAFLVVVRADAQDTHVPRRGLRPWIEKDEALAKGVAGKRDHSAELATAQHTDGHVTSPSSDRAGPAPPR